MGGIVAESMLHWMPVRCCCTCGIETRQWRNHPVGERTITLARDCMFAAWTTSPSHGVQNRPHVNRPSYKYSRPRYPDRSATTIRHSLCLACCGGSSLQRLQTASVQHLPQQSLLEKTSQSHSPGKSAARFSMAPPWVLQRPQGCDFARQNGHLINGRQTIGPMSQPLPRPVIRSHQQVAAWYMNWHGLFLCKLISMYHGMDLLTPAGSASISAGQTLAPKNMTRNGKTCPCCTDQSGTSPSLSPGSIDTNVARDKFNLAATGPSSYIHQPAMVLNVENLLESSPAVLALEVLKMNADELTRFEAMLDSQFIT
eukprot:jgi/Ulvmu1/10617/UM065_0074.1